MPVIAIIDFADNGEIFFANINPILETKYWRNDVCQCRRNVAYLGQHWPRNPISRQYCANIFCYSGSGNITITILSPDLQSRLTP